MPKLQQEGPFQRQKELKQEIIHCKNAIENIAKQLTAEEQLQADCQKRLGPLELDYEKAQKTSDEKRQNLIEKFHLLFAGENKEEVDLAFATHIDQYLESLESIYSARKPTTITIYDMEAQLKILLAAMIRIKNTNHMLQGKIDLGQLTKNVKNTLKKWNTDAHSQPLCDHEKYLIKTPGVRLSGTKKPPDGLCQSLYYTEQFEKGILENLSYIATCENLSRYLYWSNFLPFSKKFYSSETLKTLYCQYEEIFDYFQDPEILDKYKNFQTKLAKDSVNKALLDKLDTPSRTKPSEDHLAVIKLYFIDNVRSLRRRLNEFVDSLELSWIQSFGRLILSAFSCKEWLFQYNLSILRNMQSDDFEIVKKTEEKICQYHATNTRIGYRFVCWIKQKWLETQKNKPKKETEDIEKQINAGKIRELYRLEQDMALDQLNLKASRKRKESLNKEKEEIIQQRDKASDQLVTSMCEQTTKTLLTRFSEVGKNLLEPKNSHDREETLIALSLCVDDYQACKDMYKQNHQCASLLSSFKDHFLRLNQKIQCYTSDSRTSIPEEITSAQKMLAPIIAVLKPSNTPLEQKDEQPKPYVNSLKPT